MTISTWPQFDSEQIAKVSEVLRSGKVNYWTGKEVKAFEKDYSDWAGTKNAIALANGSVALSAAYLAIGLGPGDEIITTPRTFIATASAAVLIGARPIFADVDPNSGAITPETIEPLITPRTKAISVVHLAGWPADIAAICDLAKSYKLFVVEDCAQAHGASLLIDGIKKSVGSFGDIAAWSFCQDKIISTGGEGGMITTSDSKFDEIVWSLKDHGKSKESLKQKDYPLGFRWLHEKFGSNLRLTELQSAIGRLQLRHLPEWTDIRTRNALCMAKALDSISTVRVPLPPDDLTHAWYKFYCYIKPSSLSDGWDRDRIVAEIMSRNYPAFHGGCSEIYLEKCFQKANITPSRRLKIASELGETSLMFLVHPTITEEEMLDYSDVVKSILRRACK